MPTSAVEKLKQRGELSYDGRGDQLCYEAAFQATPLSSIGCMKGVQAQDLNRVRWRSPQR